uniref:cardiolipin synthase (CMP-forming) n=1 Tax=Culicoides sonorensis TaxID=179676 RepID=A0A336MPK4_CULSO
MLSVKLFRLTSCKLLNSSKLYQFECFKRCPSILAGTQWHVDLPQHHRQYASSSDVPSNVRKVNNFQIKTARGVEIVGNVTERTKKKWKAKKDDIQKFKSKISDDIKEKKEKVKEVKERVEEVIERENVLTIPNLLTVSRIFVTPYLGYVIVQGDFQFAMGILAVAAISDMLDGYIARNWEGQASRAGSFLDPMADKILIGCLVISLTYGGLFPLWLTGLIVSRDVLLILIGFVIRYKSLPPPRTLSRYFDVTLVTAQLAPTFISKVNTAIQLTALGVSLGAPVWNYIDHPYLHYLWYFTGFTTAAAALSYVLAKDTYKIFKKGTKVVK